MRTPIAWLNTFQNKTRTLVALAGVSFSILLIFMQVGFLDAARKNASIVFPLLEGHLLLHSRSYLTLPRSDSIDPYRVIQARAHPEVERSTPLWINAGAWKNPDTGERESCMVFGVDPRTRPFSSQRVPSLDALSQPYMVFVDTKSRDTYGSWALGQTVDVSGVPLKINGTYGLGTGLLADGSIMVSRDTFSRIFSPALAARPNFALLQLRPGADPRKVIQEIEAVLPKDIRILSKEAMMRQEQKYFINVKPVGIMFKVGAFVAFLVGATILYQILASEITRRLREFATLKAMGYPETFIYGIGIKQGLIFCLLGYLPSALLAHFLYGVIQKLAGLPLTMELPRALLVLTLSLLMCVAAGAFSLYKVKRADPADLF